MEENGNIDILGEFSISLVIGCINYDLSKCKELIRELGNNINYIQEIIVIFSNVPPHQKQAIENIKDLNQVNIRTYTYEETLFPGESRNIGVRKSKGDYIAFLDAGTKPQDDWLEIAKDMMLISKDYAMILGRTKYIFSSNFEECFVASTYGVNPLSTVPGTLISKKLFNKIGNFLPSTRSGEDAEWINRAKYFQNNIKDSRMPPLRYQKLKGKGFVYLCKKWFNYYSLSTGSLLVYQRQRYFYILASSYIILAMAFSWNDDIANWDESSLLYIPHVSKVTFLLLILAYLIFRVFLLPMAKGVKIKEFNLISIVKVLFISAIIDVIKTIAFIKASLPFRK